MKLARFFAVIFGIVGLLLMIGSAALCFWGIDAPVRAEIPQAAQDCAGEFGRLLSEGDLTSAAKLCHGSPSFGTEEALTEEAAAVWEIYRGGIVCDLISPVYVEGTGFAVDASLTVPKVASVTDTVTSHARALLEERIAVAEKMAELYDDSGEFRQELIDEIMAKAVELAFAEEPETMTVETTFTLAYQDGQWWVVPDTAFLQALSGGL